MATMALHVHARIAASVGKGFYTIGPCGEESLSAIGMLLEKGDSSSLHYRHTAVSLARQWRAEKQEQHGGGASLSGLLLGRARGYTVSRHDPVTGGVHCSIGGGDNEYVATSTLASQCPPAVGRALGYSLKRALLRDNHHQREVDHRPISFVTIGDGSLHNHHFLSSLALAKHARHRRHKCPVVFGISDNGFSISYRTHGFVDAFFANSDRDDPLCPVFRVGDSGNMLEVYSVTKQAIDYSRSRQAPSVVLYGNVVRRFGHAATDRQLAYMDADEIARLRSTCVVLSSCVRAVEELGCYPDYCELSQVWEDIWNQTEAAFQTAIHEPGVTLDEAMDRVAAPLAPIPVPNRVPTTPTTTPTKEQPRVMRKHMTRVIDEAMEKDGSIVYLGEDVKHGGYYLVTDGLAQKHPLRVLDFPPDETTLLGAALGFSQLGLLPVVEIPYAKYLDCGADLFYEIAMQHWLTRKQQPRGMVVRLQGFDRGIFGGNFHTHNALSHVPPGIDLVSYSNGSDYARGFRHAVHQARHGRVVVLVDCTNLLNLRHVHDRDKDRAWEFPYPTDRNDVMEFDAVVRYGCGGIRQEIGRREPVLESTSGRPAIAVVSYGNGVVTCLRARRALLEKGVLSEHGVDHLDVIDCPYLSGVPGGLERLLRLDGGGKRYRYDHVLFADVCKEGPGSNVFSSTITALQRASLLPPSWAFVGAPRTYNPLGSTVSFLNVDTVENALVRMLVDSKKKQINFGLG